MTDLQAHAQAVSEFVHDFHRSLTLWFSGEGDKEEVWKKLVHATPPDMTLVYPSGQTLAGAAFLDSIRDLHATSPGFVASIHNLEVLHASGNAAVVAYVEAQEGARQSSARNLRSALALVQRTDDVWAWRYIQETALPANG